MTTIAVQLELGTPVMPNFLELKGTSHQTLDHALAANGAGLRIDVGRLDDEAVEAFIKQWGEAFRTHVRSRRAGVKA